MSKISERLEVYQTQMSIYAEQYQIILASDVLDMIEQLQDDLKDTMDGIVEQLEEKKPTYFDGLKSEGTMIRINEAIEIVKAGGKDD